MFLHNIVLYQFIKQLCRKKYIIKWCIIYILKLTINVNKHKFFNITTRIHFMLPISITYARK